MRCRRGLTLLELIIVMAIMVIVASLAVPGIFQSMDGHTKVVAAADMVRGQWAECRAYAIEEARPYLFSVVPNSGKFKIEPYTGVLQNVDMLIPQDPNQGLAPAGQGGQAGAAVNPGGGHVIEDRLPKPVRFGTADSPADANSMEVDSSDYVPVAIFLPNGTTVASDGKADDIVIVFGAQGSSMVTVRLRALTGMSAIVPNTENGK
jgi:prepilin-type N-terminal cleavage/methylation domain-containing protein